MTAYMNVLVSVRSEQAMRRFAMLRGGVESLNTGIARTNNMAPMGQRHIASLSKFGNQLQWTGRMIQYNFTLPLAAAAIFSAKWALEQDKAMTHVAKVYGDLTAAAEQFRKESKGTLTQVEAENKARRVQTQELKSLDEAFTAISNHYGVQKKEVLEVAGAWAAAGASGRDLAESVNNTMKAIIIGDMDAAHATKALISIQAQYNLSTQELMGVLANLNSVENQTGASMSDLITGFEKAAGVARSAGVETQQLAAYMAALVPATGSASTAGNALKTIMSRLLGPTKESVQVMEAMGIQVTDMSWQSATVSERLQIMAEKFGGLGAAAQNAASSVIASRWQINKFDVLMRELTSNTGYYAKALESAEDQGESFKRMQEELNTVLESDPRALQRFYVMLQNAMVKIIQPLIPYILYLADSVADLATSFANLDPYLQKMILFGLAFIALVGPVVKYMGALTTLFSVLAVGVFKAGRFLGIFNRTMTGADGATKVARRGILQLVASLLLLDKLKYIGTIFMTGVGYISAAFGLMWRAIAAITTTGWLLSHKINMTGWAIQLGIWRAGIATQLLNLKLFYLSFVRFWAATSLTTTSLWGRFWIVMKTLTVAALGAQIKIVHKFYWAWVRIWTATALVTTNIWGRMFVALALLARNFVVVLIAGMKAIIPFLLRFGKFLTGPWGIALGIITGLIYNFRDQLVQIWNNIVGYFSGTGGNIQDIFASIADGIMAAFRSLPEGVQSVMVSIVTIIQTAALAVYEWFQYINPWAQHSPSLVDNVTTGMAEIKRQFSGLSAVKNYTRAAYAEIKRFGDLTAKLGVSAAAAQQAEDRKTLRKAGAGQALGSYNRLAAILAKLNPILKVLEERMNAQQRVVDTWQKKVEAANRSLDVQNSKLDALKSTLDGYASKMQDAEDQLSHYANAPLEGMREMERRIFRNQVAQTKLRWEMMKFEDVYGTFDELRSKIDAVNGAQELLRGEQASLRAAGAGSEILGRYDKEIGKLDQQKDKYQETADQLSVMQVKLDALQRQSERLDLVKAMKFDELQWQIEMAANRMQEMPFDKIMAGIRDANAQIDKYGPKVDAASAAVDRQQKVVDRLTSARDKLQQRLDKEEATLSRIKSRYDEVNDAISAVNSALSDVIGKAGELNSKLAAKKAGGAGAGGSDYVSPGLANFLAAGKADFPDPGGLGIPPRVDWSSQAKEIDKFTEQLANETASMFEGLNPFKPLKEKAIAAWAVVKEKTREAANGIKNFFSSAFEGISFGGGGKAFDRLKSIGEFITEVLRDIGKGIKAFVDLVGPDVKRFVQNLWEGLKNMWDEVGPELAEFGELISPLGEAFQNAWKLAKPILGLFLAGIGLLVKVAFSVAASIIKPVIGIVTGVIKGIIKIIRGLVEFVIGVFTLDWKMAWKGVTDIFTGFFGGLWAIFSGAFKLLWGVLDGFVRGVWGFFKWLYNILLDNGVVSALISGIIDTFGWLIRLAKWVWKNVIHPIVVAFVDAKESIEKNLKSWWGAIKNAWKNIKSADWWKDKVLQPVKDAISRWWDERIRVWKSWWDAIKNAWSNVKNNIKSWWSNNVWEPVTRGISTWWTERKRVWKGWWADIKQAWSNIKSADWWKEKVLQPIRNAITDAWQGIKDWLTRNKDMLLTPMKNIVNGIIWAVNKIISGLNKVSDVLPGVEWNIEPLQKLAEGGQMQRRANRGFKTNGARAIVGEGKANHPEFVIPTDPTYRSRAASLLGMAAAKIGLEVTPGQRVANSNTLSPHGIPQYGIGGWLGDRWDNVKNMGKKVKDLPRNAAGKIMNPLLAAGRDQIRKIGWNPAEAPPLFVLNKLEDWVKGTDRAVGAAIKEYRVPKGGNVSVPIPSNAGGISSWKGGAFTNNFIAHMRKAESLAGASVQVMQGGFRPATSYSGTSHRGDAVDFQVNNSLIRAFRRVGIAAGDRTGLGNWAPHTHAIPGPGAGLAGGSAIWQWQDYMARGGMNQSLTSPWGLKGGGIALARKGPVVAGDGRYDEAVLPLPKDWRTNLFKATASGRTVNIYGDLSFPNITSGDDAETFLENLEILAKD